MNEETINNSVKLTVNEKQKLQKELGSRTGKKRLYIVLGSIFAIITFISWLFEFDGDIIVNWSSIALSVVFFVLEGNQSKKIKEIQESLGMEIDSED